MKGVKGNLSLGFRLLVESVVVSFIVMGRI